MLSLNDFGLGEKPKVDDSKVSLRKLVFLSERIRSDRYVRRGTPEQVAKLKDEIKLQIEAGIYVHFEIYDAIIEKEDQSGIAIVPRCENGFPLTERTFLQIVTEVKRGIGFKKPMVKNEIDRLAKEGMPLDQIKSYLNVSNDYFRKICNQLGLTKRKNYPKHLKKN